MPDETQWKVTKVQLYWSETHWRGRVERHYPHDPQAPADVDWNLKHDCSPTLKALSDRLSHSEMIDALNLIAAKVGVTFSVYTRFRKGEIYFSEGPFFLLPEKPSADLGTERMLKWFAYEHLPDSLKAVSSPFSELADVVVYLCEPGPERTVALRKLLEAKDAAVRARLHPGG